MKQRFECGDKMREFEALGMRKFQHEISNAGARYADTHNRHQSHTSYWENRGQETRERLFKYQEEHEQQEERDQDKEESQHKI